MEKAHKTWSKALPARRCARTRTHVRTRTRTQTRTQTRTHTHTHTHVHTHTHTQTSISIHIYIEICNMTGAKDSGCAESCPRADVAQHAGGRADLGRACARQLVGRNAVGALGVLTEGEREVPCEHARRPPVARCTVHGALYNAAVYNLDAGAYYSALHVAAAPYAEERLGSAQRRRALPACGVGTARSMSVRACVRACKRACVRVRVCAFVLCACVVGLCACVDRR